ncbi:MAG: DUF2059 domain-containing protein [Gemmatimonadota bacterium]
MIRKLLLLLTLLGSAGPLAAQEPTPGQLRAAERLVDVMRLESNWGPVTEQMRRYMRQAVPDTGGLPGEAARQYRETMDKQLQEVFTEKMSWERLQPEYVRLYASLYTEDELRQLTAFYESPLGQKSIRIQPEVTARMLGMVQRLMAQDTP